MNLFMLPWLALSIVVNFEEGAELSLSRGDERNEYVYEIVERIDGVPDACMESHFGYGTRAGWPRIRALLKRWRLWYPRRVTVMDGPRHERLAGVRDALTGLGRRLGDFKAILAAIRNPYDMEVSRYHFLRLGYQGIPGLARGLRDQEQPGVFHVHFDGAGGNVTAGKYNDGSPENRPFLARRLADGMKAAFEATKKSPIKAADASWKVQAVALPAAAHLDIQTLKTTIADEKTDIPSRLRAARNLAWALRCAREDKIDVTCLTLGPIAVLHMPGELFVEYQLAAQAMRADSPVLMAAYGDYGPGYIGLAHSYSQGGYETGPVSRVAPEVEEVLTGVMRELLR